VAAGRPFAAIGMHWVAAHPPLSIAELEAYRAAGLAWVVVPEAGSAHAAPAGYVVVEALDDALAGPAGSALHVEQVSVDPAFAHRRLGWRLIEHVADEARARGVPSLTLTTFRDVPWNAPYYERCGFRVVPDQAMGAGLRRIREDEAARGLDIEPRVAMHRTV
jgi:GNAT superfamily N-acetyltransferase